MVLPQKNNKISANSKGAMLKSISPLLFFLQKESAVKVMPMVILDQVAVMALLIMIVFLCRHFNIISDEANDKLSGFVINIVNPAMILQAYQIKFDMNNLHGLAVTFGLSVLSYVLAIIVSALFAKTDEADTSIEKFSIVYSNCGFMGIPLINGLYGSDGVFYLTGYLTAFNLMVWTHGVATVCGKIKKEDLKNILLSPTLIATLIGIILFVCRLSFPKVIYTTVGYVAEMNTPLAMIISGVTVYSTDFRQACKNRKIYKTCAAKLLIVPLTVMLVFTFIPCSAQLKNIVIIATACPTAVTGFILAMKYKKDYMYSSQIFTISTLVSLATLPLIKLICQGIVK